MKSSLFAFALLLVACNSNHGDTTADGGDGSGSGSGHGSGSGSGGGADAGLSTTGFALTGLDQGISYTVNLTIGSQQFNVVVDTGSTSLGVASEACTNCSGANTIYNDSGTDEGMMTMASVYGDGTGWEAESYSDTVEITGDTVPATMRFGAITDNEEFLRGGYDGILGFLGPDVAVTGTDAIVAKRPIDMMALQLCPNDGRLWIGSADPAAEDGAVYWAGMTSAGGLDGYYAVNIVSTTLGSASVAFTGGAVVDSGTSEMVMSTAAATSLTSAIMASAGYQSIFGTTTIAPNSDQCLQTTHTRAEIDAALPPMQLALTAAGGGSITISAPATMTYLEPVTAGPNIAYCYSVEDGDDLPTILGDAFMRAFTVTFDIQGGKIGFAPEVGCSLPSGEASGEVHAHVDPDHPIFHPPWHTPHRPFHPVR